MESLRHDGAMPAAPHLSLVVPGLWQSGGFRTLIEWTNRLTEDGVPVTVVSATNGPARDDFHPNVKVRAARPGRVINRAHQAARRVAGARGDFTVSPLLCAPLIPRDSTMLLGFAPYNPRLLGHRPALTYMQHWESVWYEGDAKAQATAEARCRAALPAVVNSTWLRNHFDDASLSDLHLVFPGVDIKAFTPHGKHGPAGHTLRIAALGREVPFKGLSDLRQASAGLGRPVELLLFGTRDKRKVDGPVPESHLGRLAQHQLADLYRSVDVVVTPSWYESFPLPPLEAMACGARVVTSRQGTEDYAVDGYNSFVFEGRDIAGLTAALQRATDVTDGSSMREAARATAERFTWEAGYGMFRKALDATGVLPLS
jgi:glycosyltransferase involved in cell wall biosynthesis